MHRGLCNFCVHYWSFFSSFLFLCVYIFHYFYYSRTLFCNFEATYFFLIPQSVPDFSGSIITITLVNMLVSHLSKVFNDVLMTVCAALSHIPQVRCRTPVCGRQRSQTHPNRSPALLGSETFSTVPCPTALAPLFDEGVEKQSARHDSLQASTFPAIIHSYLYLPKRTSPF